MTSVPLYGELDMMEALMVELPELACSEAIVREDENGDSGGEGAMEKVSPTITPEITLLTEKVKAMKMIVTVTATMRAW